jgi:hypothetical protein
MTALNLKQFAWCRHAQHAVGEMQGVADPYLAFQQPGQAQVFTHEAGRQCFVEEAGTVVKPLRLPKRQVFGGVGVHGLVQPAVHAGVGLLVALQPEPAHAHTARHSGFANGRQIVAAADAQGPRAAGVDAENAHRFSRASALRSHRPAPARRG